MALIVSTIFCTAQQQSIKIGAGDNIILHGAIKLTGAFTGFASAIFGGDYKTEQLKTKVPYIFAEYRYPVSEIVQVGLQVGYSNLKWTTTYYDADGTYADESNYSYFLVMPGAEIRYVQREKMKLYGNFMIGVATVKHDLQEDTYKNSGMIFQLNPIGISYGDRIAGFAEMGVGFSLFNAGVKFNF